MDIDDVLPLVREKVSAQLRGGARTGTTIQHWILVADDLGVELADLNPNSSPPHELLSSLVDMGARAAAYVTYVPAAPERVLAQILTADPRNSDVRQARVVRDAAAPVELGPWENTV
jgi:hypothetical protein